MNAPAEQSEVSGPEALRPVEPPPGAPMTRSGFLRRVGLCAGTVLVVGAGALAYRAYDQGVLSVGDGPAYEAWSDWDAGKGLLPLVGAATLAPSPHNAQAWLFGVGGDRIDLHAALAAALALLSGRAVSAPRRLLVAAGLLVPGLICFTTVGRLWYVPGVLLVGAGLGVVAGLRTEGQVVTGAFDRNWTALLAGVLAALYVFLGATALGLEGVLGIAGGLLVLGLIVVRGRLPVAVAVALVVVAAVPFAALTW